MGGLFNLKSSTQTVDKRCRDTATYNCRSQLADSRLSPNSQPLGVPPPFPGAYLLLTINTPISLNYRVS